MFHREVLIAGKAARTGAIIWLELPANLIVSMDVAEPKGRGAFRQSLLDAMRHPGVGAPRQPSRIRVASNALADELRPGLPDGVDLIVAPVPELDTIFADVERSMPESEWLPSYLAGGAISPETVGRLFKAAISLFRAAPWTVAFDSQIIRADVPDLGVDGAVLCVIGAAGESYGLLLFRSLDAYQGFVKPLPPPDAEEESDVPDDEAALLSVSFDRKRDMPPSLLREIKVHGWDVAGARAYPNVFATDGYNRRCTMTERDVRLLTACTSAFLALLAHHPDLFETDALDEIRESFEEESLTVTLASPYGPIGDLIFDDDFVEDDLFDDDDFEDVLPALTIPKVGRNDPCPCGSGKKYKKCHY